ncbi:Histone RNA hairpin binding protein RNA binding domain [Trypanosoma vivax]|nr:Histone RNA hairpin binding protein RNA binding domain [Trypanosoma vivax]
MVISEERHLNYSGVELDQSELNSGDTVEKARRLQQRRRQVQYGKETTGYSNYVSAVPCRCDREFRNPMHPMTPRPEYDCSKRTFDRYLNIWRRQLHLWDDYNPKNLEPQYTRIGIPTLKRLGLEPVQSTPEGHRGALLSFTPTTGQGVMGVSSARTACTPIVLRQARRESSLPVASASTQRPTAHQSSGHATVACSHCPITAMPHIRPSSSCGCGSWSITNTPHTPYYGSTNSNSSYPPPLLSVLAQPTIYSPHWADSSRQSSPNPITGQRGCGYPFHYAPGGCQVATSGPPGGGGPWESCNCYMNGNCNNYAALGYVSPYGGPRGTPHSPPNQYHHSHYGGLGSSSMPAPSPMCVGQEGWGSASRQMHQ